MNENIHIPVPSGFSKVEGKVDLQYLLEDGSVIHNKSKNTAFVPSWSASNIFQLFIDGNDNSPMLYLTDYDGEVDTKFPFLQGHTVGFSYPGASAKGNYCGAEIKSKRIISTENNRLTISHTYEWLASQVPGQIRKIGYTYQGFYPYSSLNSKYAGILTLPLINMHSQMAYQNFSADIVDSPRSVGIIISLPGFGISDNKLRASFTYSRYSATEKGKYTSWSINHYLTDYRPNSYSSMETKYIYDEDTGDAYAIFYFYVRKTSSSEYEYHRQLVKLDFENQQTSTIWDVILQTSATVETSINHTHRLSPVYADYSSDFEKWLIKRGQTLYTKINASNLSDVTKMQQEHPEITSGVLSFPYASLQSDIKIENCYFFPTMSEWGTSNGSRYDPNFTYGYNSSRSIRRWVLNFSGDICFISTTEYIKHIDENSESSMQYAYNLLINTYKNKSICVPYASSFDSNSGVGLALDGAIERWSIGEHEIYAVPRYSTVGNDGLSLKNCANNQICQALTCYSVPKEAQTRPENTGIRIVYELTISNPT